MNKIGEKYNEVKARLGGTREAEAEAREIMAHVCGCEYSQLYLRFFDDCENAGDVDGIVEKRLSGMPLAYAVNEKNFYGYSFYVDENVLIPRSDTECVVEHAIRLTKENGYSGVLDMCCGSGCMGIALCKEAALAAITFADKSNGALGVAKRNAVHLLPGVEKSFVQGDLFENIRGTFDIILCNPPYISDTEYAGLEAQVRDYEPAQALLAGEGGCAFYRRIAQGCKPYLRDGGSLVLEIGYDQREAVCELLNGAGFDNMECGKDLAGRDRWVSATV